MSDPSAVHSHRERHREGKSLAVGRSEWQGQEGTGEAEGAGSALCLLLGGLSWAKACGWTPPSSWTHHVLSKELGSQEGRGGLEQGCSDHVGLKALLPQFRVFVGFLGCFFFP